MEMLIVAYRRRAKEESRATIVVNVQMGKVQLAVATDIGLETSATKKLKILRIAMLAIIIA